GVTLQLVKGQVGERHPWSFLPRRWRQVTRRSTAHQRRAPPDSPANRSISAAVSALRPTPRAPAGECPTMSVGGGRMAGVVQEGAPRRSGTREQTNRWLLRARDTIDRDYAKPLDISALARVALMSEAHFIR